MKWFEPGLKKPELKQRYRELVKQYHPDTNTKDKSLVVKMQEIFPNRTRGAISTRARDLGIKMNRSGGE